MKYFGYGSNLNLQHLGEFCQRHGWPLPAEWMTSPLSTGHAIDCDLTFNRYSPQWGGGVLSLSERVGHLTPGVLFDIMPIGKDILNVKEGHPFAYQQCEVAVLTPDGQMCTALSYKVPDNKQWFAPSATYQQTVQDGWNAHGLDTQSLSAAIWNQKTDSPVHHVFVYGTLMHDQPNHHWFKENDVLSIQPATTSGILRDSGHAYPIVELSPDQTSVVHGELIELADSASTVAHLDRLEGFSGFHQKNNLYERRLKRVQVHGQEYLAWIYVAETSHYLQDCNRISSGDWKAYLCS